MTLSGDQERRLHEALLAAFSKQDLVELMRFKMETSLYDKVVEREALATIAFQLIEWLIKQGDDQLQRFVEAIYRVRKGNVHIVAICCELAPYLAAGPSVNDAQTGIKAVTAAADRNGALKLQLAAVKGDLQQTSEGIAILGDLKKVHDQLHTLELRLYRELRRTARNFRDKPTGIDEEFELGAAVSDLTAILRKIHQRVERLPLGIKTVAQGYVETMDTAQNAIVGMLEKHQGDPLYQVNGLLLDGLLGLAPFTHSVLFREVAELRLSAVIKAFEDAIPLVNGDGRLITQAVAGLRHIHASLRDLVQEHSFWQRINVKLHFLERSIGKLSSGEAGALGDVEALMPPTLNDVEAYCKLRTTEAWSSDVIRLLE